MFANSKLVISLISTRYVITLANFATLILALKALTIEEFADLQRVQIIINMVVMIGITWTERIFFSQVRDNIRTASLLGDLLKIRFLFVIFTLLLNIFWVTIIIKDLNLFGYILILTVGSVFQSFTLFLNYMHAVKQTWRITSIRVNAALLALGLKVAILIFYPKLLFFLIAVISEQIIIFLYIKKSHSSKINLTIRKYLYKSQSTKSLLKNNIALGMTIGLRQKIRNLPLLLATSIMSDISLVSFATTFKVFRMFGVISSAISYAVGVQILKNAKIKKVLLVNSFMIIVFWILMHILARWVNKIDGFWTFMNFEWRLTELSSISLLFLFVNLTALWEIFLARNNASSILMAPYVIFSVSFILSFFTFEDFTISTVLSSILFCLIFFSRSNWKGFFER